MLLDAAVPEFVHPFYQTVQELPVVRNHNDRSVVPLYRILQNIFRPHIHVVGRLVEYQQVVGLEHQPGHRQPGPLTARQDPNLLVDVLTPKQERP